MTVFQLVVFTRQENIIEVSIKFVILISLILSNITVILNLLERTSSTLTGSLRTYWVI